MTHAAEMMKNRFRMELANEGYELRKLLSQNDIRNKSVLQNCLNTFNDHLKVVISKYAWELGGSGSTSDLKAMDAPTAFGGLIGKGIGGVGGWMAGGALAGVTVATKTTGWWIFKKTVAISMAGSVASALGISIAAATFGISVILAGAGVYAASKLVNGHEREGIINKVMENYEHDVVPGLLEWFDRETALLSGESRKMIGWQNGRS